jgi:hypothetical protein
MGMSQLYSGYYMFRIVLYKGHFTFLAQHLLSLHNTHIKPFKFRSTKLPKRKELSLSKKLSFLSNFKKCTHCVHCTVVSHGNKPIVCLRAIPRYENNIIVGQAL